ncbi:MAG: FAD-binding protein [Chloroflexi bacterium]|nr:FAD-binding protein [Chloroflexota bacterium]
MAREWVNWSGSLRFTPERIETPDSEQAVAAIVQRAAEQGRTVRVAGRGHSSSPLVQTDDTLASLERLQGIESVDTAAHEATIRAGMTLQDAGEALFEAGLAMHNLGDVNVQQVIGGISTGTHGTGRKLPCLSAMLVGGRMVIGSGEVIEFTEEQPPGFLQAARVGLGVLGIITSLRLRLLPAYKLHRQEWCTDVRHCLDHLDELVARNRNFDFYWYPRSDEVKLRTWNLPGEEPGDLPYATLVEDRTDWAHRIITKKRTIRFDEMEYGIPAEAGVRCFLQVRRRMKDVYRKYVGWRLLYRTVAPDDACLSIAHGCETVTISVHHNAGLPFEDFFRGIEPILRDHEGRPHWGKKHTLRAEDLRPLYPQWDVFLQARQHTDPQGVFLTPYLRELLGVPVSEQARAAAFAGR